MEIELNHANLGGCSSKHLIFDHMDVGSFALCVTKNILRAGLRLAGRVRRMAEQPLGPSGIGQRKLQPQNESQP